MHVSSIFFSYFFSICIINRFILVYALGPPGSMLGHFATLRRHLPTPVSISSDGGNNDQSSSIISVGGEANQIECDVPCGPPNSSRKCFYMFKCFYIFSFFNIFFFIYFLVSDAILRGNSELSYSTTVFDLSSPDGTGAGENGSDGNQNGFELQGE